MSGPRRHQRSGSWQELADLPFAADLVPHTGGLAAEEAYDGALFDRLTLDSPDAAGSRFLECAFTRVSVSGGTLRRAHFTEVWLREVQLVATSLAESSWTDVTFSGGVAAGVEAFGSQLRRVTWRGCKLDSVNFREAALTDVTFEGCVRRDVDFGGAVLTRTAFPGCQLSRADFSRARMDRADLRGAELGLTIDPGSLRGAIVTSAQLAELAPLLAASIGIVVDDSAG